MKYPGCAKNKTLFTTLLPRIQYNNIIINKIIQKRLYYLPRQWIKGNNGVNKVQFLCIEQLFGFIRAQCIVMGINCVFL